MTIHKTYKYIAYFCKKKHQMKPKLLFALLIMIAFTACQKDEQDTRYLITKNRIGDLTKDTRISQLKTVFSEDSLVQGNSAAGSLSGGDEITVYKKGGQELLRLQPATDFDTTSTISSVQVVDTIYKTEDGLGRGSDFEVLESNYNISRIENTLGTAMVFVDELNIYVDIDKEDILEPTEMGAKIKTSQIKDNAEIKRLWLDWD